MRDYPFTQREALVANDLADQGLQHDSEGTASQKESCYA